MPQALPGTGRVLLLLIFIPLVGAFLYGLVAGGHIARAIASTSAAIGSAVATAGFTVADVRVVGRSLTPREDVAAAIGATRGMPLFDFDVGAARERLENLGWIETASVRRQFPGRLEIHLTERKPVAVWQHENELRLVDARGRTIMAVGPEALLIFPHVVGRGADVHAAALLGALRDFPEIESRVRAAVRVGDRRWNLELANGVAIELPAENVAEALSELRTLNRTHKVLDRDIEAVDMRLKDRWIIRLPTGSADIKPGPSRST